MLIAALIRKTKNEELGSDFYMWEKDENLNNCRECQGAFTVMKRRHHCRNCGGLFCEACTLTNVLVDGETCDRCCHGCIKGETPGENVRNLVERKFANVSTADPRVSIYPLAVNYGSQFDIDAKSPAKAAPTAGYFELINKTNSFCAVKIIYNTTGNEFETLREIPRPSYTAVPPNGIVNCNFPTDISFFELFILMSNPNQVPPSVGNEVSSSLVYNTKASSASAPLKVSPAASIRLFRHFQAYRIRCDGKNVMLKYKADGSLEPRAGNSIARVGVFGKLLGSGKSSSAPAEEGNSSLDFSTNVSVAQIEKVCSSTTMHF